MAAADAGQDELPGEVEPLLAGAVALANQIDHTAENMVVYMPSEAQQALTAALELLEPYAHRNPQAFQRISGVMEQLLPKLQGTIKKEGE